MGKRLDSFFARSFKSIKFRRYVNLVVSRIAFLKIQHHVRWSQARSDVVHLISLGHQETTILRVEHVIREQNMLDVFAIIEGYCRLLIERVLLIENTKTCPDELKEAISSLIFAASRFGQLPELRKIRQLFISKFGKQFAACATELRNDCGVNPKMVNKLPIRRPSLGTRLKLLKEIAAESGVTICIEGEASEATQANNVENLAIMPYPDPQDDAQNRPIDINRETKFSNIMKSSKKYKDAATAAQEAFELAAHAAIAAKAAVELSQLDLCEKDDTDPNTSHHQQKNATDLGGLFKSCLQIDDNATLKETDSDDGDKSGKIICMKEEMKNISTSSSSGCDEVKDERHEKTLFEIIFGINQEKGKEIGSEGNNEEKGKKEVETYSFRFRDVSRGKNDKDDDSGEKEDELEAPSPKWFSWKAENEIETCSLGGRIMSGDVTRLSDSEERLVDSPHSKRGRRPISVRTKRMHRPFF